MPSAPTGNTCCDRCADLGGADAGKSDAGKIARRRLLKAAIFRPLEADAPTDPKPGDFDQDDASDLAPTTGFADVAELPRAVSGTILDISPHVLIFCYIGKEHRQDLKPYPIACS